MDQFYERVDSKNINLWTKIRAYNKDELQSEKDLNEEVKENLTMLTDREKKIMFKNSRNKADKISDELIERNNEIDDIIKLMSSSVKTKKISFDKITEE